MGLVISAINQTLNEWGSRRGLEPLVWQLPDDYGVGLEGRSRSSLFSKEAVIAATAWGEALKLRSDTPSNYVNWIGNIEGLEISFFAIVDLESYRSDGPDVLALLECDEVDEVPALDFLILEPTLLESSSLTEALHGAVLELLRHIQTSAELPEVDWAIDYESGRGGPEFFSSFSLESLPSMSDDPGLKWAAALLLKEDYVSPTERSWSRSFCNWQIGCMSHKSDDKTF